MAKKYIASDVVKVAHKQKGYKEKRTNAYLQFKEKNAGSNNFTKYGKWIGANGDYWCASYLSWIFYKAYGTVKGKQLLCGGYSASCETIRQQFRNKGQYHENTPKVGDVIFFKGTRHAGANHIGLVWKVADGRVYTSEGNADDTDTDNGGAVVEKSYPLNYTRILGYGRPKYDKKYDSVKIKKKGRFCEYPTKVKTVYCFIQAGEVVSFVKDMGNGWSKIKYQGKTGYIKNYCLKKDNLSSYNIVKLTSNAPLRKKNKKDSKRLIVVPKGTVVYLVSEGKVWSNVKATVNGKKYDGFIAKKHYK